MATDIQTDEIVHLAHYAGRRPKEQWNGKVAAKPVYAYRIEAAAADSEGTYLTFAKRLPGEAVRIGMALTITETSTGYRFENARPEEPMHPLADEWVARDMATATRLAEDRMVRKAQTSDVEQAIETLAKAAAKLQYTDRAAFASAITAKVLRG